MALYVVSDLHIWGPDDPLYSSLLHILDARLQSQDTLVLAGDIFDLFVGNKSLFVNRYEAFLKSIDQAIQRGAAIHYIEGNHDFLLKRAFARISGFHIHPNEVSFAMGGKRFFIAHGDLVDKSDFSYRALRRLFRSPIMKGFIALSPAKWLDYIGKISSAKSRKRNERILKTAQFKTEKSQALRKIYRNFAAEKLAQGYDFVIMGHCHDLDEMKFKVGARQGQYINVGYPRIHGSFLSWSENEEVIQREALPKT